MVAQILTEQGGFAIIADKLAHAAMSKGQPAYNEIVSKFGELILGEDGEINRAILGKQVFDDKEQLKVLEQIIHPRVIKETQNLIAQAEHAGPYTFAVIDAPLLIEAGMHTICDSCWLVTSPNSVRIERIMSRDGLSEEAATKRLASRAGDSSLMPYADIVINNNGGINDLRQNVIEAIKQI